MSNLTILTIDDEENIRNGLADNFELEGYNVKAAGSGKEGLKIIETLNDDEEIVTDASTKKDDEEIADYKNYTPTEPKEEDVAADDDSDDEDLAEKFDK